MNSGCKSQNSQNACKTNENQQSCSSSYALASKQSPPCCPSSLPLPRIPPLCPSPPFLAPPHPSPCPSPPLALSLPSCHRVPVAPPIPHSALAWGREAPYRVKVVRFFIPCKPTPPKFRGCHFTPEILGVDCPKPLVLQSFLGAAP